MKYYKYLLIFACVMLAACSGGRPPEMAPSSELPDIFPDYTDVTIPAQIAPMNFDVNYPDAELVYVKVKGSKEGEMETSGKTAEFDEKK